MTSPCISAIRAHAQGIGFWWVGNGGWLIKSGGLLIGTDLDLSAADKLQPPPVTAEELAPDLDVAFVTHHHSDHCHPPTLRLLAAGGACTFVVPRNCVKILEGVDVPRERIVVADPGRPFDVLGMRVEPIHAIHGNQEFTVLTREPDWVESVAQSCGYIFNLAGRRIFQPGDSVLTEEHLGLRGIDVLFLSPTVHNMYVDRSVVLAERLRPAYIVPQHFGTYRVTDENAFWTRGYPDELRERLPRELRERYHQLRQGETFTIPAEPTTEGKD